MAATGGVPVLIDMHPVMPLGKAPGFDDEYEQVAAAIAFGKAEGVVEMLVPPPDMSGQLTIGYPDMGPDTPNSHGVLTVLRHLATDQEFLNDAVSTAVPLAGLATDDLEALAPGGMGHNEISTMPAPVSYQGALPSEEFRELVTRMARARIGAVVKSLSVAHKKQLTPIADDPGIAAIVGRLSERFRIMENRLEPDDEERLLLDRLGRLHHVLLQETYIGEDLDHVPMEDILRLRTKAWGESQRYRNRLFEVLHEIALEERDARNFDTRCRNELEGYRNARGQIQHDWTNVRVKIECGIGAALATSGSGVIQKLFGTSSLESLLLIGGVMFTLGGDYIPELRNRILAERQLKASAGYGLATPYRALLK